MADPAIAANVRKIKMVARLVQFSAFAGAALVLGPELIANYVTYEGTGEMAASVIVVGGVLFAIGAIAGWIARGFTRGLALREAEALAEAGIGDAFVIESVGTGHTSRLHRVVTEQREPDPLPLGRLEDQLVEGIGGSWFAYGLTAFLWLFFATLILGFAGVFEGHAPSFWAIAGMALISLGAAASATFRWNTLLSNRDQAVHSDIACLGFRRRSSQPYDAFKALTVQHSVSRPSSGTSRHGSSSSKPTHLFGVLLTGAEEVRLQSFSDAFQARGRARQLADYMGKPLAEPEVEDVSALPLMEANP